MAMKWLKKKTARLLLRFLPEYSMEIQRHEDWLQHPGAETFRVVRRYCGARRVVTEIECTGYEGVFVATNALQLQCMEREVILQKVLPDWYKRLLLMKFGYPADHLEKARLS